MSAEFRSILPSAVVLGTVAVLAVFLTVTRDWTAANRTHLRGAALIALLTVFGQAVHFTEELLTGFDERFPALLGLDAMSPRFFVWFNLAWLVVWGFCVWGLAARRRAALFPLWFLGVAGMVNGVGHPALAALAGEYFPGLVTAPIMGVLGLLLVRRLLLVTRSVDAAPTTALEHDPRGSR